MTDDLQGELLLLFLFLTRLAVSKLREYLDRRNAHPVRAKRRKRPSVSINPIPEKRRIGF